MANLDEPNDTPGGGEGRDDETDSQTREVLEQRIRELERQAAQLKTELVEAQAGWAKDRALLNAVISDDLPRDEAEYKEWAANTSSFSELLRGLEGEFGLESPR